MSLTTFSRIRLARVRAMTLLLGVFAALVRLTFRRKPMLEASRDNTTHHSATRGSGYLPVIRPAAFMFSLSLRTMPRTPHRLSMPLLISLLVFGGCAPAEEKTASVGVAAAPVTSLPPFQQEIASVKAEVTLPGSWKYGYRLIDRPDTTFGGHQAIEFHYSADSAAGVPPRLLMVIRAFKKANWEKVRKSQDNISRVLVTQGDEVYTFSIVTKSPYPVGSASTLRVDAMMLDLVGETSPFKMRFKDGTAR